MIETKIETKNDVRPTSSEVKSVVGGEGKVEEGRGLKPLLKPLVKFDDFAKLDLRVARIVEAREHSNADKLLVLKIDLGFEQRQICAGLKTHYTPEELVGRLIIVLANLESRSMRGEVSQGMLLAASDGPMKQHVVLLGPSADLPPGSVVS